MDPTHGFSGDGRAPSDDDAPAWPSADPWVPPPGSASGAQYPAAAAPPPPRFAVPPAASTAPPQYVPGPPIGVPPEFVVPPFPPTSSGVPPFTPSPSIPPPAGLPAFPFPTAPTPPAPNRRLAVWLISIVAAVFLVPAVLIFTVWIVAVGSQDGDSGAAPAIPSVAPSSGAEDPDASDDPAAPSAGQVEATLQRTIDEYKNARRDGSLWERIPETEFNQTAVTAFLYLLTDLRLAASFGADTSDYLERADELERRLLNQEPLGTNISIKLSDRTFTYDGETGEGGYTPN